MTPSEVQRATLPTSDAVRFDALEVPANRRSTQGTWYDAFALSERRFAVSIGSVAAGAEAADLMVALRDVFAGACAGPSASATLLNAAAAVFRRRPPRATGFATTLVGIVDCVDETFTYVSAGHPSPYVRYHGGSVAALPSCGVPLEPGEREQPPAQIVVDLNGAALLLLYAGTLVRTATDSADGGRRLRDVLADERMKHCSRPAAWIARRMLESDSHDGAALLALSFPGRRSGPKKPAGERPSWKVSWSFDSTAAAANGARRAFLACLASKDSGASIDLAAAELIFGELLGNVVRHAPGPVEIMLDWSGELPVLHVLDSGPGFRSRRKRERLPVDDLSESGRGLFIVNACATQFSVRNRNGRGTHASATLPAA
jgi:anti-sigma regulatory factor (Ser/Thr protein kinase)